jgi:GNAT superfamily N-acetyltransferase
LHALEVPVALRRQGAARNILGRAASWAGEQGATRLALAVTAANGPARALYGSVGMRAVGEYHYRIA